MLFPSCWTLKPEVNTQHFFGKKKLSTFFVENFIYLYSLLTINIITFLKVSILPLTVIILCKIIIVQSSAIILASVHLELNIYVPLDLVKAVNTKYRILKEFSLLTSLHADIYMSI